MRNRHQRAVDETCRLTLETRGRAGLRVRYERERGVVQIRYRCRSHEGEAGEAHYN